MVISQYRVYCIKIPYIQYVFAGMDIAVHVTSAQSYHHGYPAMPCIVHRINAQCYHIKNIIRAL